VSSSTRSQEPCIGHELRMTSYIALNVSNPCEAPPCGAVVSTTTSTHELCIAFRHKIRVKIASTHYVQSSQNAAMLCCISWQSTHAMCVFVMDYVHTPASLIVSNLGESGALVSAATSTQKRCISHTIRMCTSIL